MIGIIITQQILDQNNHAWLNGKTVGTIVTRPNYPNKFWVTKKYDCAYQHKTAIHEADGWRDVVQPSYNPQTQIKGAIYFDEENDVFTYVVTDKTNEQIANELQQQAIASSQSTKQQLIQQKVEAQIVEEAQQGDDTNALDNQALFPMWQIGFEYTVDFKCQDFTDDNILVLYKCIQAHTSQSDWRPKDVPALFVRVAYPNEIPVFVQPTGSHDAYQTGDQVLFPDENGNVYESTIDNNVWSPLAYPQGWQLVE